ncbi:MAG: S8 family serine peptidase, partial [Planctomycetota bacterium]
MHRKLLCIALALFAYPLPAQQADDVQDLTARGIGTEAVPGKRPGTRRYIVHFRTRSFDTCSFRDAIRNGESAAAVDAIVGNLKRLALRDQAGFRHAIQELGGSVEISFWLVNAASIEIDPVHLDKLRKMGNVAKVEKDVATYPLVPRALPFIKVSTDANHHNADAEFTLGNKATGLGVAIVDTSQADNTNGVGKPHQTYYRGGNKTVKTGKGIDGSRLLGNFQLAAQPANNSHPHGTGVASIAAGGKWNTAQADHGHAADADIIGYSICQFSGSCSSTLAIEAAGWQRVAADKVKYNIVCGNMSYGSSPDPTSIVQKAIDAVAADANVLPVTAAGNSGSSTRGSSSTANGIAVGATSVSKTMASFSSRGPLSGDTLRFCPDMAANGVGTVMARNIRETSNYVGSGTSMASPQVCGAAALVKNANKNLSAREIKALLLVSTE